MKFLPCIKQYLTRVPAAIRPSKTKAQEADPTPRNYSILLDRWIPGVLFVLLCFLFVLLVGRLFSGPEATWLDCLLGTSDLETAAKRETIKDLAGALFGFIVVLGLYVAFRRTRALEDTAQAQHNANEQKLFNDATAKLGDKSPSVRLGGIYALDRLARLNETYLASIVEILCAHLRETAQQDRDEEKDKKKDGEAGEKKYAEEHKDKPSNEIQSLLEVLSELNRFSEEKKKDGRSSPVHLNLSGAYLVGANLETACLNRADLSRTNMREAYLLRAQLQEARLWRAQMQEADLAWAHMQKAVLNRAHMQGAVLNKAQMQGAYLYGAQMQGVNLEEVQMQGASLSGAQMRGVNLRMAQMQGARLDTAHMQGAALRATQMQEVGLYGAQMQGADLWGAQMQGADLQEAQMQGAVLQMTQMQGAVLQMTQMQGARLEEVQIQGADVNRMQVQGTELQGVTLCGAYGPSPDEERSVDLPMRIKERQDKKADLRTMIFSGGLTEEEVQHIKEKLTECQENGWMKKEKVAKINKILEEHQGKPASNQPPSGIKTGSYDKKEAEAIIAEYEWGQGFDEEKIDPSTD